MDTVSLAGTDLKISRVCLGTMTFGGQTDSRAAAAMLDLSVDRGVNFIDTANVYNAGRSETVVGELLRGRRDRVILASKVGVRMSDCRGDDGLSPRAVRSNLEASLRRLRTDYLDLYYLHRPDDSTALEDTMETFERLVREGKIRYPAASNFSPWQYCRMLWLAEKQGYRPIRAIQTMYSVIARRAEEELMPLCRTFGLPAIAYNPLAGGLLTGKHHYAAPAAPHTRFHTNAIYRERYWRRELFDAVDRLRAIAENERRSLVSLSLCWLLHHTPVACVIVGASDPEQLEANLDAVGEDPLSETAARACDEVWNALRQ